MCVRETTCQDCGVRVQVASNSGPLPKRCEPHTERHTKAMSRERDRRTAERRGPSLPEERPCADCSTPVWWSGRGRPKERCNPCRDKRNREMNHATTIAWMKANPERVRENQRRGYQRNVEKIRASKREQAYRLNYGLTRDDVDRLLAAQDGKCKICRQPPNPVHKKPKLHVDHDHKCCPGKKSCGKCVRALLCGNCNTALGLLKEDPLVLAAAAAYVAEVS